MSQPPIYGTPGTPVAAGGAPQVPGGPNSANNNPSNTAGANPSQGAGGNSIPSNNPNENSGNNNANNAGGNNSINSCLLYTSPSPRDA